jgi:hypothetical protein
MNNNIRIARLKLLFIAAKVVKESNVDKVKPEFCGILHEFVLYWTSIAVASWIWFGFLLQFPLNTYS